MQNLQYNYTVIPDRKRQAIGLEMKVFSAGDPGRPQIEQEIRSAYEKNFGANFSHFMPSLISAAKPGQKAHLRFGICAAADHDLYLESYLPEPIEACLSHAICSRVERSSIAEIGNLSLNHIDNLQHDLFAIATFCQQQGYRYVVCTATRALRLLFLRAGMKPVHLGNAEQHDAPADGAHWGSYYESRPQIIGGNILLALQHLRNNP